MDVSCWNLHQNLRQEFASSSASNINTKIRIQTLNQDPQSPTAKRPQGVSLDQQVLNPTPLNPTPATCHKQKTEVALQSLECCAAEVALQHSLFCSAEVTWTKSCAAASEKLHCNIEIAALQESGAFLPLSCGFQAPTFRHPRLGPANLSPSLATRTGRRISRTWQQLPLSNSGANGNLMARKCGRCCWLALVRLSMGEPPKILMREILDYCISCVGSREWRDRGADAEGCKEEKNLYQNLV